MLKELDKSKIAINIAIIGLAVFHQIGLIGLHLDEWSPLFRSLTPLNLLLSLTVLLLFHNKWRLNFAVFLIALFWAGYLVEVVGVKTGILFGTYAYGQVLGPKIAGVPPMIGVNWVLLTYICFQIAGRITNNMWLGAGIGAGLMVLLDLFIEPMAVKFDMWQWAGSTIPVHNFFGWFCIAYGFILGYYYLEESPKNPIAAPLYVILLLFFMIIWIIDLGQYG